MTGNCNYLTLRLNKKLNTHTTSQVSFMGINNSSSTINNNTISNKPGYQVLVVDDYQPFQEILATNIRSLPEIKEIDFGNSGLDAIKKAEIKQYDLIFLDVMMPPGIDGYDACARLRTMPAYKVTPIIMVSGMDSPYDEAKGIISGCTTYVTKPIQHIPFLEMCKDILKTIG